MDFACYVLRAFQNFRNEEPQLSNKLRVPTPLLYLLTADVWGLVGTNLKTMNLQFSRKELAAIISVADAMIKADGKIDEMEQLTFAFEMTRLGVREDNWAGILADVQQIAPAETFSIISNFGNEKKKYVAAFLITLMAIDGNIADAEMKLWKMVSIVCKLPTMDVNEAAVIMNKL